MVVNLYSPGYLPGQELAPSQSSEGCQRVAEPDLSPLLYKPKPADEVLIRLASLPNNVANIGANIVMNKILFVFAER